MGIREQLRASLAVAWKEIKESTRYPLNIIFSGITIFLFSLLGELFGFFAGTRHSSVLYGLTGISDVVTYIAVGLFVWVYMAIIISDLGWGIMHERFRGTLEQIFIAPMSRFAYFLGRILSDLAIASMTLVPLIAVVVWVEKVSLNVNWPALVLVFLVTTVSFFGFGFLMAALVLVVRRVGQLFSFLQMLMLGLCDILVPVDSFPPLLRAVAMCIPLTLASRLIKKTCVLGMWIFSPLAAPDFVALCLESVVYFAVGILVYRKAEDWARKAGTLMMY